MAHKSSLKILVTSGSWQSALACVQSLGRAGHEVYVIDEDEDSFLACSKYCTKHFLSPIEEDPAYFDFLLNLIHDNFFDILIPLSDQAVKLCSQQKKEIEPHIRLLIPNEETVALAINKIGTCFFAQKYNVPIPKTWFPSDWNHLESFRDEWQYPCIVKESFSISGKGVFFIENKEKLNDYLQKREKPDPWPAIQEVIPGDCYGFMGVVENGEAKSYFTYKIPYCFSRGGTPTVVYSLYDETLIAQAKHLCGLLKWTGAVNFDYMKGPGGKYLLLEINPRFGGTLNFPYRMGINLPLDYVKLIQGRGEEVRPKKYRSGIMFRTVFPNQILHALYHKNYWGRFVRSCFTFSKINVYWDDPRLVWRQMKETRWMWQKKQQQR